MKYFVYVCIAYSPSGSCYSFGPVTRRKQLAGILGMLAGLYVGDVCENEVSRPNDKGRRFPRCDRERVDFC